MLAMYIYLSMLQISMKLVKCVLCRLSHKANKVNVCSQTKFGILHFPHS